MEKGFEYRDGKRYLLGIEFPEMRTKFDGNDKTYLKELASTFLNIMDVIMEQAANKESYKKWLLSTDFFHAPSSTKYHSAFDGGLLYHSMLVLECLVEKIKNPLWSKVLEDVSITKIAFVALTHDFCKIDFYATEKRNKKVYSPTGAKKDEGGAFDWVQAESYSVNEKFAFGHGEKSVYIIERRFFRLDETMAQAIRAHMGFADSDNPHLFQNIAMKCPLALALSEADQEASMLLEYMEEVPVTKIKVGIEY